MNLTDYLPSPALLLGLLALAVVLTAAIVFAGLIAIGVARAKGEHENALAIGEDE